MKNAFLLQIVQDAGEAVLTLTEDLERDEFLRSRLIRPQVLAQLLQMAQALADAPDALRHRMPEIDWAGWRAVRLGLADTAPAEAVRDDTAWFAARSLVPATLSWLRVYRPDHPELFDKTH